MQTFGCFGAKNHGSFMGFKCPSKPPAVLASLQEPHAYTTIMTVLKRMSDKNLVTRHLSGNTYFYSPLQTKSDFATSSLEDLFLRLFNSYGEDTVTSFKKVAQDSGYKLN